MSLAFVLLVFPTLSSRRVFPVPLAVSKLSSYLDDVQGQREERRRSVALGFVKVPRRRHRKARLPEPFLCVRKLSFWTRVSGFGGHRCDAQELERAEEVTHRWREGTATFFCLLPGAKGWEEEEQEHRRRETESTSTPKSGARVEFFSSPSPSPSPGTRVSRPFQSGAALSTPLSPSEVVLGLQLAQRGAVARGRPCRRCARSLLPMAFFFPPPGRKARFDDRVEHPENLALPRSHRLVSAPFFKRSGGAPSPTAGAGGGGMHRRQ